MSKSTPIDLNASLNTLCWHTTAGLSTQPITTQFMRQTQLKSKVIVDLCINTGVQGRYLVVSEPLAVLA